LTLKIFQRDCRILNHQLINFLADRIRYTLAVTRIQGFYSLGFDMSQGA
jgi:hypothetical protein